MKKYLFIVLLVFFWSCEEDNTDTANDFENLIIGCWENEEPWDDNKKINFTTLQANDGEVINWIVSWTKRDDLEFSQYCVE